MVFTIPGPVLNYGGQDIGGDQLMPVPPPKNPGCPNFGVWCQLGEAGGDALIGLSNVPPARMAHPGWTGSSARAEIYYFRSLFTNSLSQQYLLQRFLKEWDSPESRAPVEDRTRDEHTGSRLKCGINQFKEAQVRFLNSDEVTAWQFCLHFIWRHFVRAEFMRKTQSWQAEP